MILKSLKIQNFRSIEEIGFKFDEVRPTIPVMLTHLQAHINHS